jgi:hypothetical protein
MDREARKFRQAAARHIGTRTGTAIRYTSALRRRALAFAEQRRRSGVPVAAIARELGLRPRLLRLWLKGPHATPRLRRVTMERSTPPPASTVPTLVTPQGFRIEGLDIAGLAALLRGLV